MFWETPHAAKERLPWLRFLLKQRGLQKTAVRLTQELRSNLGTRVNFRSEQLASLLFFDL